MQFPEVSSPILLKGQKIQSTDSYKLNKSVFFGFNQWTYRVEARVKDLEV